MRVAMMERAAADELGDQHRRIWPWRRRGWQAAVHRRPCKCAADGDPRLATRRPRRSCLGAARRAAGAAGRPSRRSTPRFARAPPRPIARSGRRKASGWSRRWRRRPGSPSPPRRSRSSSMKAADGRARRPRRCGSGRLFGTTKKRDALVHELRPLASPSALPRDRGDRRAPHRSILFLYDVWTALYGQRLRRPHGARRAPLPRPLRL